MATVASSGMDKDMERPAEAPKQATPKAVPASHATSQPPTAPAVPDDILQKLSDQYLAAHSPKSGTSITPAAAAKKTEDSLEAFKVAPPSVLPTSGTEQPVSADDGLSDPKTDRAIDDIVAKEGDEILAAEDAKNVDTQPAKIGFWRRIGLFLSGWWHNKWARWITIVVLLTSVATVAAVHCAMSVVVLDGTTQLPLKNVTLAVGGQKAVTDVNGVARVYNLPLGKQTFTIQRIAFATIKKQVTLGWGSNPQGEFALRAVGTQYAIMVVDYLSDKPLANVEAVSDGIEALSDKNGKVILTLDNKNAQDVPITLLLNGYREEHLTLPAANSFATKVKLVTERQEVFISKQTGKYDLYKMDIDGKNKQVLLAGTGLENEDIALIVSPAGDEVALVSTRDNLRDSDGYLLSALTLVSVKTGAHTTIDHANRIRLADWIDHRLVYSSVAAGASAASPNRNKLISYDYVTNSRVQLAGANQFNGVASANGFVYYVVAASDPAAKPLFAKVRPDGTGRQTILAAEVWSLLRLDYNTFAVQTSNGGWTNYSLQTNQLVKATAPPVTPSRLYVDSPDGKRSVRVETRDGKGVLLAYTLADGKEAAVQTHKSLTYPLRWLTDKAVVYRVADNREVADYVVSLDGGTARKITDVTRTQGLQSN